MKPAPAPPFEPDFVAALRELFEQRIAFNHVLGLRIGRVTAERVEGQLEMRPELIGHYTHQRLHGGVISATLDAMAGLAIMAAIGARHKRTRPFRPQTNGKAERFNKTLLAEWAYVRMYDTNQARLDALPAWLAHYNTGRPHGSLGGRTPMSVLVNNVSGNHT